MKQLQIAVWACLLTLCMMLPANAAPVVAAIGAIAGVLKAGGLAATLIKFAFGVALQVGSSLLKKVAMKKQPDPGINGQVQLGGNKSLSFIVGTYATAGHLEYVNTHGRVSKTPNAVLTQVITVSDLPVQSIGNSLIVNGALCTRNTSTNSDGAAKFGATSYPIDQYKHDKWYFLFCKYYLGNNATADPNLVAAYNSHARPWSADMIGRGVAYHLLKRRGYEEFMVGTISMTEFAKRLAMEWASFPVLAATKGQHQQLKRGQSYYDGDALNKALVSPEAIEAVLHKVKAAGNDLPVSVPEKTEAETQPPEPEKAKPVSHSKRFWTWLTAAALPAVGLLDWRVQLASVVVVSGIAVYAIYSMPSVKSKVEKLFEAL